MVSFTIETVLPYTRRVNADDHCSNNIADIIVNEAAALIANGHIIKRWPAHATPEIIVRAKERADEILELKHAAGFE